MSDVSAGLTALVETAEQAYRDALGGEAACTIHRDGRVTGGLTYHEGRLVALRAARRILDRDVPEEWIAALTRLHDHWSAELEKRRTSRVNTPPWIAYATGGLDGAAAALQLVDQPGRD